MVKPDNRVEIKRVIGDELRKFFLNKYGTLRKAGLLLNCSPAYLSAVIHGKKKLSHKYRSLLIKSGFDESLFYDYISTKQGTDESSKMVIYELKRIIDRQELLLSAYRTAIVELRNDYDELRKRLINQT